MPELYVLLKLFFSQPLPPVSLHATETVLSFFVQLVDPPVTVPQLGDVLSTYAFIEQVLLFPTLSSIVIVSVLVVPELYVLL